MWGTAARNTRQIVRAVALGRYSVDATAVNLNTISSREKNPSFCQSGLTKTTVQRILIVAFVDLDEEQFTDLSSVCPDPLDSLLHLYIIGTLLDYGSVTLRLVHLGCASALWFCTCDIGSVTSIGHGLLAKDAEYAFS